MIKAKLTLVLTILVGFLMGCFSAMVVGHSMLEITFSPMFTLIFGAVLEALAAVIAFRVLSSHENEVSQGSKIVVISFCSLMCISGLFCLLLDVKLVYGLSYWIKIPMYTLLGISLSFSLTYAILDLATMGFFNCNCLDYNFKVIPMIAFPIQIFSLSFCSILIGAVYGFLFAVLDVEDEGILTALTCLVNYMIYAKNRLDKPFDPAANRGEGI